MKPVSLLTIGLLVAATATFSYEERNPTIKSRNNIGSESEFDISASTMRPMIERFSADRQSLQRFYDVESSEEYRARFRKFYADWQACLSKLDFSSLNHDGKIDYIAFSQALEHSKRLLELHEKQEHEAKPYLPFADKIIQLEVRRQTMHPIDPKEAAATLAQLTRDIANAHRQVEKELSVKNSPDQDRDRKVHVREAVILGNNLVGDLRTWFTFYNGYDPMFTWWAGEEYRRADDALQGYLSFLSERGLGLKGGPLPNSAPADTQTRRGEPDGNRRSNEGAAGPAALAGARPGDSGDIIGNPIGRDALMTELEYEMIPYTPEQLLAIANKEFAWCENEMKQASREMGLGDNWKQALEKVKNDYVEPGKQPEMIRKLALEAIQFMDEHDLVTIPAIARETWRMRMMTPQQQLVNPFFTGGETISVSYPTDSMTYESKLMSMRGNNYPMSKATVFHELIPGHELQGFMAARFRPYRGIAFGRSAFVTEGWSLYWELLLWDMKFQKTPEERVGALFWHMHRCARIIFSLSFHLGKMTPEECINFLVDRVGFERENAVGEVRRSFAGSYGPLYQAGYLLGGMQLYALHKELVGSGKMTNRQFHDAILRENYIPVELMRADLMGQALSRDYRTNWKFYGDVTAVR